MTKFICDRCGKETDRFRAHMTYSGNNEADFCKDCFEDFTKWLANKPDNERLQKYEDKLKDYEKAIQNYNNQITKLVEQQDKTRSTLEWWKTQCNEFYKDYKTLSEKLEHIFLHGSVR